MRGLSHWATSCDGIFLAATLRCCPGLTPHLVNVVQSCRSWLPSDCQSVPQFCFYDVHAVGHSEPLAALRINPSKGLTNDAICRRDGLELTVVAAIVGRCHGSERGRYPKPDRASAASAGRG